MFDQTAPALRVTLRRHAMSTTLSRSSLGVGAAVLGVSLVAAGAYGLRDTLNWSEPVAPRPAVTEDLARSLPAPAIVTERPGAAHRAAAGNGNEAVALLDRPEALAPPAAEAIPPRTSQFSRIFRGAPPVVPPGRPSTEALSLSDAQSVPPRARPGAAPQPEAPRAFVSLRPQQRPADLAVPEEPRIANRAEPEAKPPANAAPPVQSAAVKGTPEIVRTSLQCPSHLSATMPRRSRDAAGASAVMAGLGGVEGVTRDAHVVHAILSGNMPRFMRDLKPVSVRGRAADGGTVVITICVTPDYLAVGSDSDHTRIPLGLRAASQIAGAFDMVLPTPRMVDLIHRAADLRLTPRPMPAGPRMRSTDYLTRHNATVSEQIRQAGATPGRLVSGHKKDVVLTSRLAERPGRVAIYGWHQSNGKPIQPLSTVHGAGYADYSHGVRLVSSTAYLNGRPVDLRALLASPSHAALLSDEGPVKGSHLRMAALAAN